jgi:probable F420-dependent oxidoreductase
MAESPLRFCVPLPMVPADHLVPMARAVEDHGYDSIAVPDSVFFPKQVSGDYPYTSDGERFWTGDTPFVDPFVAVSAMSAVTSRIRFVTNVVKLPLRHPLLVAKQVASIAALSNDRFTFGVGLSWMPEEFEFTGTSMKTRGARVDEAIDAIRAVVTGEWGSYSGKHYRFDELKISPAASKPVPIWIGGHSEPALARAARTGDGWITVNAPEADVLAGVSRLRELRGGSLDGFEISALAEDVWDVDGWRRLHAAGVTEVQVLRWYSHNDGGDPDSLDVRLASLGRFADDVLAQFR